MIDTTKEFIFIWVPGTMGHEVHPVFEQAVHTIAPDGDYQLLCVEYPAKWNFDDSVPYGEEALWKMLREVHKEKAPEQKVLVAGSSQGAWVISNVMAGTPYNDTFATPNSPIVSEYRTIVHKTVLFGQPGVAVANWDEPEADVWEISDLENDAVTFEYPGKERKLIRAIGDVFDWKLWHLFTILWFAILHPVRAIRMLYVILTYAGILNLNDSPHDYGRWMPLAVYWLVN